MTPGRKSSEFGANIHFALEQIDITLDPALNRRYEERIPVLALDGDELFELRVDA